MQTLIDVCYLTKQNRIQLLLIQRQDNGLQVNDPIDHNHALMMIGSGSIETDVGLCKKENMWLTRLQVMTRLQMIDEFRLEFRPSMFLKEIKVTIVLSVDCVCLRTSFKCK